MAEKDSIDREPDVETPFFKLWLESEENSPEITPLIEVYFSDREELFECRTYDDTFNLGYHLLVMTKRKVTEDGESQYYYATKGKRPNGQGFIQTELRGPLTLDEYKDEISFLERNISFLFDIDNPEIVPGSRYNIYAQGLLQRTHRGGVENGRKDTE